MTIKLRPYSAKPGFTPDFFKVRDFLRRIHEPTRRYANWDWVRWEWSFSLSYLDETQLSRIGLWEDDGKIVALANYESVLGTAYFSLDEQYPFLKQQMIEHAMDYLYIALRRAPYLTA